MTSSSPAEQVEHLDQTIARLRKLITISDEDLERFEDHLDEAPPYRPVVLHPNLSPEELARFEVDRDRKYPGVDVAAALVRSYPLGASSAHVLGYVSGITASDLKTIDTNLYQGLTQIGKAGLERSHEAELRGTPGVKIVEANASGRPLRELDNKAGVPGRNLYLGRSMRACKPSP